MVTAAELVALANEAWALGGRPPKWTRFNILSLLRAFGIGFRARADGAKRYVSGDDLTYSGLWAALQKSHRLADALRGDEDEPEI